MELCVCRRFLWQAEITDKVIAVCKIFGVTTDSLSARATEHSCKIKIKPADVIYITGSSGAGKSVLLREIEKAIPKKERTNLNGIKLAKDKTLIDCINGDVMAALKFLSCAGLNDVFTILAKPVNLSDGQKYRFRLAMAFAKKTKYIFADEFCSNLDRITAAVISHQIYKFAKRTGKTFILASSHDDILADLEPDVLVVKDLAGPAEVIYKEV
ncbi:MAG: ABC transporter [Planctomycetes bacterium]|nr:ABC transporter [Planctomycetota bacterium]